MAGAELVASTDDPIVYNIDVHFQFSAGRESPPTRVAEGFAGNIKNWAAEIRVPSISLLFWHGSPRTGFRHCVRFTPRVTRWPSRVSDNLHPWMSAWWLIVDHPYSAVTDAQGRFTIRDVPVGPQRVVVWHEAVERGGGGALFAGEVEMSDTGPTEKEFTFGPLTISRE